MCELCWGVVELGWFCFVVRGCMLRNVWLSFVDFLFVVVVFVGGYFVLCMGESGGGY